MNTKTEKYIPRLIYSDIKDIKFNYIYEGEVFENSLYDAKQQINIHSNTMGMIINNEIPPIEILGSGLKLYSKDMAQMVIREKIFVAHRHLKNLQNVVEIIVEGF